MKNIILLIALTCSTLIGTSVSADVIKTESSIVMEDIKSEAVSFDVVTTVTMVANRDVIHVIDDLDDNGQYAYIKEDDCYFTDESYDFAFIIEDNDRPWYNYIATVNNVF